jgi:hypothetical protein
MSCCGNKRSEYLQQYQVTSTPRHAETPPGQVNRVSQGVVYFQYIGQTALNVRGIFSRIGYHFPNPGSILAVDLRDASGLAAVPHLRRVKPPE